ARGALAGPVRQHGEAVARGRQRRERRLDLVVARQLQHLPTPRVDIASLGRRATEQRPTAVEPVAPETARRLERSGGHDPQRGGRADVEGDARGVGAVRADVARGDVTDGGKPIRAAERGPAHRPRRPGDAPRLGPVVPRDEAYVVYFAGWECLQVPARSRLD